jgi:hypothetical protein
VSAKIKGCLAAGGVFCVPLQGCRVSHGPPSHPLGGLAFKAAITAISLFVFTFQHFPEEFRGSYQVERTGLLPPRRESFKSRKLSIVASQPLAGLNNRLA